MAKTFEVEVKSLLGSKQNADRLKVSLKNKYNDLKLIASEKQLNHYFNTPKDLDTFQKKIISLIPQDKKDDLVDIIKHGQKISIRTRQSNKGVLFIIKASVGSDTSSNGVRRIELEVLTDKTIDELDQLLIDAGASYQAKWSREREEYSTGDLKVSIDKNAGYGYLSEFEKIVTDEKLLEKTHKDILDLMKSFDLVELDQARLERMFDHYNKNWKDYYGTDKTFIIK
jgi:adenylate cyclase class IV